jgi:orotate phosphoribosyltransferase-like protein
MAKPRRYDLPAVGALGRNETGFAGGECGIKSLLIVDESVSSGRTIAAVLAHLRRAGLPKDCIVYVAAAAWLVDKKLKPMPAVAAGSPN